MNNNTSFIYLIILNTLPWEKKQKTKTSTTEKSQQKRMYKL